jgi:cytochrome c553
VACARCHGVDGAGGGSGAFPRLAGQSQDYLLRALSDYAEGKRQSGIMQPIAAALAPADRVRLAAFYASSTAPAASQETQAAGDAGATLAANGDPARGVPACAACHATDTAADAAISALYPRLAGQHAWYLRQQLKLWRTGRGGTPLSDIMNAAADNLTDDDIAALATYYAALPPFSAAVTP